jgi:Tfp pilus assembly protein PilW
MGNLTLFDIIASAIIASILLMTVHSSTARMNQTLCTSGNDLSVQTNLVNVVRIIEKDFRRIGYCADQSQIPDQTIAISAAGAHNISFLTDINNDGIVDTLQYDVGSPSALTITPNPRDMLLNRYLKGTKPKGYSVGLTRFDFTYYNATGDTIPLPITDFTQIADLRLTLAFESTSAYDSQYQYAAWRQMRLKVRNLDAR